MMRFAAYCDFHYWLQFELAAYNVLIVGRNLPIIKGVSGGPGLFGQVQAPIGASSLA
jgi:hypothetical protein